MYAFASAPPISPEQAGDGSPHLDVTGLGGSRLRATSDGLIVLQSWGRPPAQPPRFWAYDLLQNVRLDVYGTLGVIRANVRATGNDLPLLLLEPEEIPAARRVLEMVWNIMAGVAGRRAIA